MKSDENESKNEKKGLLRRIGIALGFLTFGAAGEAVTAAATGKKKNIYVKYLAIMVGCMVIGGIVGGLFAWAFDEVPVVSGFDGMLNIICSNQIPILCVLTGIAIAVLENALYRIRKMGTQLETAADEECDRLEYEMDRIGAVGSLVYNLFIVLSILVIATGYSFDYIKSLSDRENTYYLIAMGIFIVGCIYSGMWQTRFVKLLQKIYPEKKGDPTSMKFQKQWLESCDEAEKEVIYQSSYKTYIITMRIVPFLLFVSMISHLMWNTGLMAIFMIGVIWIIMTAVYTKSCITKKSQKINSK